MCRGTAIRLVGGGVAKNSHDDRPFSDSYTPAMFTEPEQRPRECGRKPASRAGSFDPDWLDAFPAKRKDAGQKATKSLLRACMLVYGL